MPTEYAETALSSIRDADQYLTFFLANEEYGVDIHNVQEVRGWDSVTPMPNAPRYIKGVINLRGSIVPIIDLRERFNQESVPYGPRTVVIVIKVRGGTHTTTMGIVVDAVSDVYNVGAAEIQPAPDFCAVVHSEYVKGLATVGEKMIILLDSDRLLSLNEMAAIAAIQQRGAKRPEPAEE